MEYRTGIGFDVHRLVPGRPLVLGGIVIPFHHGLLGHSDGDVLLHALADAMLGAAGLGDIGQHFPDSDPRYRGIDSMAIITRVSQLIRSVPMEVVWVDAVVVAEKPKILPYVSAMRERIGVVLGIGPDRVSIKGKTTEGLGFTGRGEGIAVTVVVTVRQERPE